MNPNDTKTAIAKVHCKKPENLEQAAYDLGVFMYRETRDVHRPLKTAGHSLIDGPLSDLSILVQIPKVRELAEAFVEAEDFIREEYEYLIDRDPNDQAMTESWRAALEATDG